MSTGRQSDLSPRYHIGFEHVGNLMQRGGDFWEIVTNIPLEPSVSPTQSFLVLPNDSPKNDYVGG